MTREERKIVIKDLQALIKERDAETDRMERELDALLKEDWADHAQAFQEKYNDNA